MASRVLLVAPQPFFRLRGACLVQSFCLNVLAQKGASVDLLTLPFGESAAPPGVRVYRAWRLPWVRDVPVGASWSKLLMDVSLFFRLAVRLAARRYDVVHACEESVVLAALLKPVFGFKLVYDMDDVLSLQLERSGYLGLPAVAAAVRAVERWALRSADAVLTNSVETTAFARRWVPSGSVFFYHHMPELPAGAAPPAPRRGGAGPRTILYAGNFAPYQGLELLMDALPAVLAARPGTRCVVIGGQPSEIAALKARAERLGTDGAIDWEGVLPFERALERMGRADVLVSPMTRTKAVPMKLYAYLAAGVPIVATDLPAHRELLDDSCSVLAAPEPGALAGGILRVLSEPELAARVSAGAFRASAALRRHDSAEALSRAYASLAANPVKVAALAGAGA